MFSNARTGFALPAVLAVTGVVTLIFLVAITALASLTSEAASARGRSRFLERALTAEAQIAYLAATEPLSPQAFAVGGPRVSNIMEGAGENDLEPSSALVRFVRIDSRPYLLDVRGPLKIRLQDQAGLINLATINEVQMQRFAERVGLPPAQARGVFPLFRDYVDQDDLKQINGAELADYGGWIANRNMLRPAEWLSLLGVRAATKPRQWQNIQPDLAYDPTSPTININTATPLTLEVLFGLTAPQANRAVVARQSTIFLALAELAGAAGGVVTDDPELNYTFPSGRIIYSISDGRSPWIYRARMTLTPSGAEQPLWIDQAGLTEAPRRATADVSDAIVLPYTPR